MSVDAPTAARDVSFVSPPPVGRGRTYGIGFWGMTMLIATEATIFVGLLATYFFLRSSAPRWPPAGIEVPKLGWIGVFSVVLLASSVPVVWAESAIRRGDVTRLRVGLALAWLMGAAFLAYQGYEYVNLTFAWNENAYTSIFYVTTGLHGLHVLIGLLINLQVQVKAAQGRLSAHRHVSMEIFALYWHFVDAVWIFVFSSLYLSVALR